MVWRSPPLSTEQTRSPSSSTSATRASSSSASRRSACLDDIAAVMSRMRLISSTIPLATASRNHARSASGISRAGAAEASGSVCASDHFRIAFQLSRSLGPEPAIASERRRARRETATRPRREVCASPEPRARTKVPETTREINIAPGKRFSARGRHFSRGGGAISPRGRRRDPVLRARSEILVGKPRGCSAPRRPRAPSLRPARRSRTRTMSLAPLPALPARAAASRAPAPRATRVARGPAARPAIAPRAPSPTMKTALLPVASSSSSSRRAPAAAAAAAPPDPRPPASAAPSRARFARPRTTPRGVLPRRPRRRRRTSPPRRISPSPSSATTRR